MLDRQPGETVRVGSADQEATYEIIAVENALLGGN
jgi:hypothetical protein